MLDTTEAAVVAVEIAEIACEETKMEAEAAVAIAEAQAGAAVEIARAEAAASGVDETWLMGQLAEIRAEIGTLAAAVETLATAQILPPLPTPTPQEEPPPVVIVPTPETSESPAGKKDESEAPAPRRRVGRWM